jgi:hypothetical protein
MFYCVDSKKSSLSILNRKSSHAGLNRHHSLNSHNSYNASYMLKFYHLLCAGRHGSPSSPQSASSSPSPRRTALSSAFTRAKWRTRRSGAEKQNRGERNRKRRRERGREREKERERMRKREEET